MKGSLYLADISQKIYKLNPLIKFYIMGDGRDKSDILKQASPNLIYQGFMEYVEQWIPFVQEHISVMVIPPRSGGSLDDIF